jgi:hypothetical protein
MLAPLISFTIAAQRVGSAAGRTRETPPRTISIAGERASCPQGEALSASRCWALISQVGANGVDRRLVGSHLCSTPFSHRFELYGN